MTTSKTPSKKPQIASAPGNDAGAHRGGRMSVRPMSVRASVSAVNVVRVTGPAQTGGTKSRRAYADEDETGAPGGARGRRPRSGLVVHRPGSRAAAHVRCARRVRHQRDPRQRTVVRRVHGEPA